MEMRKAYVAEMARLMRINEKIVVLDADLSAAGGTKPLYAEFPDRAVDVGIAESNMTCIAAGLAASGFVPFIHSFAPFAVRRTFDQIAVSVSYSELNVKIVGFDPGITATYNGGTHMCFEDVAMLRALPNIAVIDIADSVQLVKALPYIAETKGAMYLRFARKQNEDFFGADYAFRFGKADKIADGKDVTIISSGASLFDAVKAAEILGKKGISAEILSVHTVKPLDEEAIIQSAEKTRCVVTVENHSVHGGLYGAVAETLSRSMPVLCDAVAVYDEIGQVGSLGELKKAYKLTAEDIALKAERIAAKKKVAQIFR